MREANDGFQMDIESFTAFREYLVERENSPATIAKYQTDIRTFFGYLEGQKFVTKECLIQYKQWLVEHYALTSVNSMLAALNQYLDFRGVGNMRVKRVKIQTCMFAQQAKELSQKEYKKLLKAARKSGKGTLALMLECICATGIRISELQFVTAESVKDGKVWISNKGKSRQIFLPLKLQNKLRYYIQRQNIRKGTIFVTKNGKPKNRSNIWREMKQLAEISGVNPEKVFPHNLRHLFARMFYQLTRDLSGLADILGHCNISVTRIYTREYSEHYRKQMDRLSLVFP